MPKMDIIYVLDISKSIGNEKRFEIMKDFVKNTTDLVNISPIDNLAAVVLFAANASINISLSEYTDKNSFKNAVDRIKYGKYRYTDIPGVLKLLQDAGLNGALGLRSDTLKIIFVITDGRPSLEKMNQGNLNTQKAANELHNSGIYDQVYSIGVEAANKPPNHEVLNYIANPSSLVFPIIGFNATLFQKITQTFSISFCNGE